MTTDTDRLIAAALVYFDSEPMEGFKGQYRDVYDALKPFRTKPARVGWTTNPRAGGFPYVERTDLVNRCLTGCVLDEDELTQAIRDALKSGEPYTRVILKACRAKMKGVIQEEALNGDKP